MVVLSEQLNSTSLIKFMCDKSPKTYWEIEDKYIRAIETLTDDRGVPIFGYEDKEDRPHVLGWLLGHAVIKGSKGIVFVVSVSGNKPLKFDMGDWLSNESGGD